MAYDTAFYDVLLQKLNWQIQVVVTSSQTPTDTASDSDDVELFAIDDESVRFGHYAIVAPAS